MTLAPDWVRAYRKETDGLGALIYNGVDEAEGRRAVDEAGVGVFEFRIDRGRNSQGLTAQRIREEIKR